MVAANIGLVIQAEGFRINVNEVNAIPFKNSIFLKQFLNY